MSTYQGMTERQLQILGTQGFIGLASPARLEEIAGIIAGKWAKIDKNRFLIPTARGYRALDQYALDQSLYRSLLGAGHSEEYARAAVQR